MENGKLKKIYCLIQRISSDAMVCMCIKKGFEEAQALNYYILVKGIISTKSIYRKLILCGVKTLDETSSTLSCTKESKNPFEMGAR